MGHFTGEEEIDGFGERRKDRGAGTDADGHGPYKRFVNDMAVAKGISH